MDEYISKKALLKAVEEDFNRSWCSRPTGVEEYVDGARDEYDDVIDIIRKMSNTDVQPLSVIAEHIKKRLYETAFNTTEAEARNAIADMAERIDFWINELKEGGDGGEP